MAYLQRLLDKIDRFELLIAGLVGAVIANWWQKDDLGDWRAWVIFLITGMACLIYLMSMVSTYLGVTELHCLHCDKAPGGVERRGK